MSDITTHPSRLFYIERHSSLPEPRYHFFDLADWGATNCQRSGLYSHRRLSEVQVQGLAYVLLRTLRATSLTDGAIRASFTRLAHTCKLAALTIDYIVQGKLTDFTGSPARIGTVAKEIKARSRSYDQAQDDQIWMLIAPPDSRTGDWTSYVPPAAAMQSHNFKTAPWAIFNAALSSEPLKAPGSLLRYQIYQSLMDSPAQFFRLISDTELVTTTSAMAERRRGLLRVAAMAHAVNTLPQMIALDLVKGTFARLSSLIGPIPLSKQNEMALETLETRIGRARVFNTQPVASHILTWGDDSADSNLVGLLTQTTDLLTAGLISKEDLQPFADPAIVPSLKPYYPLSELFRMATSHSVSNFSKLAKIETKDNTTAEYLDMSALAADKFRITAAQRFLMTGLPLAALRPRYDVKAVMTLADGYVSTLTSMVGDFAGQDEIFISQQDQLELPKLFNLEPYLFADANPWLARIDRQNGPNMAQTDGGSAVFKPNSCFHDFLMTPNVSRDLDELDLPLVVDSDAARTAFVRPATDNLEAVTGFWDNSLRDKIIELIPPVGPTLLPAQLYATPAGIKTERLYRIVPTVNAQGANVNTLASECVDTLREYIARATGLSGRYLAIALTVEGNARRLATLVSSFGVFYVRSPDVTWNAGDPDLPFNATNYIRVTGDGIPYGLVKQDYRATSDALSEDAYSQLENLCFAMEIPLVPNYVYFKLLEFCPGGAQLDFKKAPSSTSEENGLASNDASRSVYFTASLGVGRRFVGSIRRITLKSKITHFVEAQPLVHMALLPSLSRFGRPPCVLLSRSHVFTLRTTALLQGGSPSTSSPSEHSTARYTTWPGISLDRLALHGETTRIISGSESGGAVEQAMAEAMKLTAAADAQLKSSLAIAAAPVNKGAPAEKTIQETAAGSSSDKTENLSPER